MVERFLTTKGDLNFLLQSVSCYDGGEHHCGKCASCFKRWVALTNATRADHSEAWGFASNPYDWKLQQHWKRALEDYSHERARDIVLAFAVHNGKSKL